MCLEYIVDYFGLNSTFLDELKILLCFVLICSYRMVQFGPWSSPGLRSVGKILCSSISNSLFFYTILAPGDICCVLRGEGLHKVSVVVLTSSYIGQFGETEREDLPLRELHWV